MNTIASAFKAMLRPATSSPLSQFHHHVVYVPRFLLPSNSSSTRFLPIPAPPRTLHGWRVDRFGDAVIRDGEMYIDADGDEKMPVVNGEEEVEGEPIELREEKMFGVTEMLASLPPASAAQHTAATAGPSAFAAFHAPPNSHPTASGFHSLPSYYQAPPAPLIITAQPVQQATTTAINTTATPSSSTQLPPASAGPWSLSRLMDALVTAEKTVFVDMGESSKSRIRKKTIGSTDDFPVPHRYEPDTPVWLPSSGGGWLRSSYGRFGVFGWSNAVEAVKGEVVGQDAMWGFDKLKKDLAQAAATPYVDRGTKSLARLEPEEEGMTLRVRHTPETRYVSDVQVSLPSLTGGSLHSRIAAISSGQTPGQVVQASEVGATSGTSNGNSSMGGKSMTRAAPLTPASTPAAATPSVLPTDYQPSKSSRGLVLGRGLTAEELVAAGGGASEGKGKRKANDADEDSQDRDRKRLADPTSSAGVEGSGGLALCSVVRQPLTQEASPATAPSQPSAPVSTSAAAPLFSLPAPISASSSGIEGSGGLALGSAVRQPFTSEASHATASSQPSAPVSTSAAAPLLSLHAPAASAVVPAPITALAPSAAPASATNAGPDDPRSCAPLDLRAQPAVGSSAPASITPTATADAVASAALVAATSAPAAASLFAAAATSASSLNLPYDTAQSAENAPDLAPLDVATSNAKQSASTVVGHGQQESAAFDQNVNSGATGDIVTSLNSNSEDKVQSDDGNVASAAKDDHAGVFDFDEDDDDDDDGIEKMRALRRAREDEEGEDEEKEEAVSGGEADDGDGVGGASAEGNDDTGHVNAGAEANPPPFDPVWLPLITIDLPDYTGRYLYWKPFTGATSDALWFGGEGHVALRGDVAGWCKALEGMVREEWGLSRVLGMEVKANGIDTLVVDDLPTQIATLDLQTFFNALQYNARSNTIHLSLNWNFDSPTRPPGFHIGSSDDSEDAGMSATRRRVRRHGQSRSHGKAQSLAASRSAWSKSAAGGTARDVDGDERDDGDRRRKISSRSLEDMMAGLGSSSNGTKSSGSGKDGMDVDEPARDARAKRLRR